jgi:hypothetical protein
MVEELSDAALLKAQISEVTVERIKKLRSIQGFPNCIIDIILQNSIQKAIV